MNLPIRSLYGRLPLITLGALLVGCATQNSSQVSLPIPVVEKVPYNGLSIEKGPSSLGAEPRLAKISFLILHHTAGALPSSLSILQGRDPTHKVGVHYVVTDEPRPRVISMVPETQAAYHAGKSAWGNVTALNQPSIGIEIINLDGNLHPYSAAQEEILFVLCTDIIRRHGILPQNVLAHSDIAVGRKTDPGRLFPWRNLAALGVGAWPIADEITANLARKPKLSKPAMRALLESYGYRMDAGDAGLKLGITAFQLHFRPSKVDGVADPETIAILQALVRRYQPLEFYKSRHSIQQP